MGHRYPLNFAALFYIQCELAIIIWDIVVIPQEIAVPIQDIVIPNASSNVEKYLTDP